MSDAIEANRLQNVRFAAGRLRAGAQQVTGRGINRLDGNRIARSFWLDHASENHVDALAGRDEPRRVLVDPRAQFELIGELPGRISFVDVDERRGFNRNLEPLLQRVLELRIAGSVVEIRDRARRPARAESAEWDVQNSRCPPALPLPR